MAPVLSGACVEHAGLVGLVFYLLRSKRSVKPPHTSPSAAHALVRGSSPISPVCWLLHHHHNNRANCTRQPQNAQADDVFDC